MIVPAWDRLLWQLGLVTTSAQSARIAALAQRGRSRCMPLVPAAVLTGYLRGRARGGDDVAAVRRAVRTRLVKDATILTGLDAMTISLLHRLTSAAEDRPALARDLSAHPPGRPQRYEGTHRQAVGGARRLHPRAQHPSAPLRHGSGRAAGPAMGAWPDGGTGQLVELSEDEVRQVASEEHGRWYDCRRRAGWRPPSEGREDDDTLRVNANVRPWDELPEASRMRGVPAGSLRALAVRGGRLHARAVG